MALKGFLWICILGFALACKKPAVDDLQPPEIELLSISPSIVSDSVCGALSHDVIALAHTQTLTIHLRFTDDVALAQAKFDIHHNFDCHGHKSQLSGVIWNQIELKPLSDKLQELTVSFTPPENVVTGNYHLGIMAVDAQGRLSQPLYFDLKVFDPIDTQPPAIIFISPEPNQSIPLQGSIPLSLQILDDMLLDGGEVEAAIRSPQGMQFSVHRADIPAGAGNSFNFIFSYNIPPFFGAGLYTLEVSAKDWKNNTSFTSRNILLE